MSAEFENIPILDGWVNLTEAAEMIGITRQHAHKKARLANEGKVNGWKTIHRIGSKPAYVVSTEEIADILESTMKPRKGTEPIKTDVIGGTLAPEDRKGFLKQWSLPDTTTDQDILMAMGSGLR